AIGAVVSAAALAVGSTFILLPPWERYRQTVVPRHIAAAGHAITADGQTWTVRRISRSTDRRGSRAPLPENTVVVNVLVERAGPSLAGTGCQVSLVEGDRTWRGGGCSAETSMSIEFLVPSDTEPTAVDIRAVNGAILVRLEL
ncbi:MAG: hypothetical protein ACSLE3_08930, partial [Microbacteriaceae bacterium]